MPAAIATATMTIVRDHREKLPYDFASVVKPVLPFVVQADHLETGDYSLKGPELPQDRIVIERKTLSDLYSTLGSHREQFEAEWQRMSLYGYAALVVEATFEQIAAPNKYLSYPTELNSKSVLMTLAAWNQRYGVQVWMMPGRRVAEQWTFRLLERWQRDHAQ
jgi:ERCC4-type nuclease